MDRHILADQGIQANRHFHLCRITARHHGTDLIQIWLHFKANILRQYTGLNHTGKRDHHTGNIQGQMVILINIENMYIRHTLCPYTFFRQFQTVHPDFCPWMTKLQNPGMFSRHAHLFIQLTLCLIANAYPAHRCLLINRHQLTFQTVHIRYSLQFFLFVRFKINLQNHLRHHQTHFAIHIRFHFQGLSDFM